MTTTMKKKEKQVEFCVFSIGADYYMRGDFQKKKKNEKRSTSLNERDVMHNGIGKNLLEGAETNNTVLLLGKLTKIGVEEVKLGKNLIILATKKKLGNNVPPHMLGN